jgi:hypothetical protein
MKKAFFILCIGFMSVMIITAQELDNKVRETVNGLAAPLNNPMEVTIESVTYDEMDAPTGFSRKLIETISRFADSNKLFTVVQATRSMPRSGGQGQGTISGNYALLGENVRVTLNLESNGKSLKSENFTIPVAELRRMGLSIEPENIQAVREREQILADLNIRSAQNSNRPAQTVTASKSSLTISAIPDSPTSTYLHGDKQSIIVEANRNCYFKIYCIDVDNSLPVMIYPYRESNRRIANNRLRADVPFDIPKPGMEWPLLHAPYGTKTILVVASTAQFKNLEAEFVPSGSVVSMRDGIRDVLTRGKSSKKTFRTNVNEAEYRFNYTIIKPHEEYEYEKPQNMIEAVQALRNDVESQEGIFEGKESGGYYILDGIRGSYVVYEDMPNVLQFAMYYLDNYPGGPGTGSQTRGRESGFSFTIDKPENMSQAVQTARSGIKAQILGTFDGDEQHGSFKVGIPPFARVVGQYNVTDRITVTITEKPSKYEYSDIENIVRGYFSEN